MIFKYLSFLFLLVPVLCAEPLTTKVVKEVAFQKSVRLGGTLKSINEQYVSTRYSGYIETLHVDVGEMVKKGQILVSIDPIEKESLVLTSKANLDRAKAALKSAEANYKRVKNEEKSASFQAKDAKQNFIRYDALYKDGVVSKRDYEQAKLDMDVKIRLANAAKQGILQAKSIVDEASAAVRGLEVGVTQSTNTAQYFTLKAKFDGVVTERLKESHELANPGEPILHVASTSPLRLSLNVPASIFRVLKVGQEVELHSTLFDEGKKAKVKTLVPYAKEGTHSYEVRLETKDNELLPGLYVEAKMQIPFKKLVSITPSMLTNRAGLMGVFIKKENRLFFTAVHVKIKEADRLGVEGLEGGEKVVLYPPLNLKDGMEVK